MIKSLPATERCRSHAEQCLRFYFQVREFALDAPKDDGLPLDGIQAALERARGDACAALLVWTRASGVSEGRKDGPLPGSDHGEEQNLDWIKTCELPYLGHD